MSEKLGRNQQGGAVLEPQDQAKHFGAYYTDAVVARFLVDWAVRGPSDRVLDPSFGGGVFLGAAVEHLTSLGGQGSEQVYGVEIDETVYQKTSWMLKEQYRLNVRHLFCADFFAVGQETLPGFDAVIGNPPFIRYQSFQGATRERALERSSIQGVALSRLVSSWAPFVVHSIAQLRPGGRLAMVIPMELAYATYAKPVLAHLTRMFRRVSLLTFREPLFPHLSQDTLLLLADDRGAAFETLDWRDVADTGALRALPRTLPRTEALNDEALISGQERLSSHFIAPGARDLYKHLEDSSTPLGSIADVGIGYVSGANAFFHLAPADVRDQQLPLDVLTRATFRGKALRGIRFTYADWQKAAEEGHAGYLLNIAKQQDIDDATKRYLASGEQRDVHLAYKCRVRSPWYSVPNVHVPDAFLTYMSGLRPELVGNDAGAVTPNTLHAVRLNDAAYCRGDDLAVLWQSSLSHLSTEIEGHAMGGGMLKLEPKEARRVRIPRISQPLPPLAEEIDTLLREGRRDTARQRVDEEISQNIIGLSKQECHLLYEAATKLRTRRYYRGRETRA